MALSRLHERVVGGGGQLTSPSRKWMVVGGGGQVTRPSRELEVVVEIVGG